MKIYTKNFLLEEPFYVEYCIDKKECGYYIELRKYSGTKLTESERCFVKTQSMEECLAILENLYNNSVTPIHLSCILEDIF